MALVYFDSSAFVKLLIQEEGSDLAVTLWDACDLALSSRLAYPEVRAALAAARRLKRLTSGTLRHAEAAWEEYWSATQAVRLTGAICRHAGQLAGQHGLRGAEAVHLASVLAVSPAEVVFAVWDKSLRQSAQAVGVRAAPGR